MLGTGALGQFEAFPPPPRTDAEKSVAGVRGLAELLPY